MFLLWPEVLLFVQKGLGWRYQFREQLGSFLGHRRDHVLLHSLLRSLQAKEILNKMHGVFRVFLKSPVSSQEPALCPTRFQKIHKSKRCIGLF